MEYFAEFSYWHIFRDRWFQATCTICNGNTHETNWLGVFNFYRKIFFKKIYLLL